MAAIDVEVALERAGAAVARFQGDHVGTVSVAAFHSVGLAVFGPLIAASMSADQPGVRLSGFDVAQGDFPLLTADHDLVLAHRLSGSPAWPESVRVEPLLFEPLDIAVRRDHPLATKAVIDPADLHDEAWVAVHEGFPLEQALSVIAGIGGSEARILHRINEFSVAAAVVEASGCVALMPRYTTYLRDHSQLVLRPFARPELGRHIDCLARPETLERANAQAVLSQIRSITEALTRN
ncbi:MAG: LysR family transcriptional regulator [Cryobacterium sp.]|nr:LysR family transcriptional regulator [Cryobacterium sp.]